MSVDGVMTKLNAGQLRKEDGFPVGPTGFSGFPNVLTSSGADPISYSVGIRGPFPCRGKATNMRR